MHGIQVESTGGPDVLRWSSLADPEPQSDQLVVRLTAAGVNFIDVYQRVGLYPVQLPFVPGREGAGTVTAVGPGVVDFDVGQTVAWMGAPSSYAELVAVPVHQAVPVPEGISPEAAAAVMLQGLTAHVLAFSTYPLSEGQRCLIHAGAGGVGLLLIQMAKMVGAEVFTTVSTEEKADAAREVGADHVILYEQEDFGEAVERLVGSKALDVVYDGVGQPTLRRGLELLRPLGMMVSFGQSGGRVDPIDPLLLNRLGSLYLTRPSSADYLRTREELESRWAELLGWVRSGRLEVRIGSRYPLSQAADAHRALESRATIGKVLLIA